MIRSVPLLFSTLFLLSACSPYPKAPKLDISDYSSTVNLSEVVKGSWTHVCTFPPYTSNEVSSEKLGFDWKLEEKSAVFIDDSVTLLVFATESEVVKYFEVSRGDVDFAYLKSRCFNRKNATFNIADGDAIHITSG